MLDARIFEAKMRVGVLERCLKVRKSVRKLEKMRRKVGRSGYKV
jgi:hypothetical protein